MDTEPSSPTIEITNETSCEIDLDLITDALRMLVNRFTAHPLELSVILTTDDHISRLNNLYFGDPDPTDVISFPQYDLSKDLVSAILSAKPDAHEPPRALGDIVVSLDTAARVAIERECELEKEVLMLIIHGFLHLIGYDHHREDQKNEMYGMQNQLLKTLWTRS